MDVVEQTLEWQRRALGWMVALSAVFFWRGSYDVFNTPKGVGIALLGLAVAAIGAYRLSRTRRLQLPTGPAVAAWGLFAVALVVAAVLA